MVLGWNSGQGWQTQKSSWQWKIWQWRLKTVAHAKVTWLMFNIRLWLFFQGSLTASLSIPPHAIKVHKFFFYFVYFLSDTLFQELPLCCVAPGIFFGSLCPCPSQVSSFLLLLFPFTYAHSHFWGPVTPSLLFPSPMPHPHHYWCTHDNHPLLAPTSACCTPGHVEAPATVPICPVSLFFLFLFCLHALVSKRTPCPLPLCRVPWCTAHHVITPCLFCHVNAAGILCSLSMPWSPFLL